MKLLVLNKNGQRQCPQFSYSAEFLNFSFRIAHRLIESQIALIAHFESGKVEQFYQINEF